MQREHVRACIPLLQPAIPPTCVELPHLPSSSASPPIDARCMPAGEDHAGGDLVLTNVTVRTPEGGYAVVLVVMPPGAHVAFRASVLVHGTSAHRPPHRRPCGSKAQLSFAVQTPAGNLASLSPEEVHELDAELDELAQAEQRWGEADVDRLTVYVDREAAPTPFPLIQRAGVFAVPHSKFVLVDVVTGRHVLMYDSTGGLTPTVPGDPAGEASVR